MKASAVYICIPAFNEAPAIVATIAPLLALGYSVVVVDDASLDETVARLASQPIHLLRHPVNLGQGAALQTATDYALGMGACVIVHFDADGQHPADQIERLLAPIRAGSADVVLGSRFLDAADRSAVPAFRRIALRLARWVNLFFCGRLYSDAHNGFRALSRGAAKQIRLRENGFAHATEILAQIRVQRLRTVEVPVRIVYTEHSQSKGQRLSNAPNIILDLVARRLLR
jgi:glycosyltransferase involved in cell wall biosynthesis